LDRKSPALADRLRLLCVGLVATIGIVNQLVWGAMQHITP
jgi:hypothetical protein